MSEPHNADSGRVIKQVWERCWCYRFGRCLVDCPTADLPKPVPMTEENWIRGYEAALAHNDSSET